MKLSQKLPRLTLLAAIGAVAIGTSAAAAASAPPVKSITTTLYAPPGSLPSLTGFTGPFYGSYAAYSASVPPAVVDSGPLGSLVAQTLLPAVPPKSTQIETFRTITSPSGNGTLRLHCSEIARPGVPQATGGTSGSCAVLGASGIYAGLHGSGKLTGTINTNVPPGQPATLNHTIVF